jgi:hypothetical protein
MTRLSRTSLESFFACCEDLLLFLLGVMHDALAKRLHLGFEGGSRRTWLSDISSEAS